MPDTDELQVHLQQLHDELRDTGAVDPESRRLLEEVLGDIHQVLDRAGDAGPTTEAGLAERLAEATRDWEAQHPVLATTVGKVVDALSNLGI